MFERYFDFYLKACSLVKPEQHKDRVVLVKTHFCSNLRTAAPSPMALVTEGTNLVVKHPPPLPLRKSQKLNSNWIFGVEALHWRVHCQKKEFYNTIRVLELYAVQKLFAEPKIRDHQGGKMYEKNIIRLFPNLVPRNTEAMKSVAQPILANANDDGLRRKV